VTKRAIAMATRVAGERQQRGRRRHQWGRLRRWQGCVCNLGTR
jgi:hypothetical protein